MTAVPRVDLDRFRLRRFVDQLQDLGELETHAEPVDLADISAIIEASPKATLFKNAGRFEIVGAVGGSRRRLAAAFGLSDVRALAVEYGRRMQSPQRAFARESELHSTRLLDRSATVWCYSAQAH